MEGALSREQAARGFSGLLRGRLGDVGEVQQGLLTHERQRDGGDEAGTRRRTGGLG